jgi:hypothetical protein
MGPRSSGFRWATLLLPLLPSGSGTCPRYARSKWFSRVTGILKWRIKLIRVVRTLLVV